MGIVNKNIAFVHRKEWQMMNPAPANSGNGVFVVTDTMEADKYALLVFSATLHYLYNREEDSYVQIPSGALAGTFGAGACGTRGRWSATLTATGGSNTSVTTTANISGIVTGKTIRFLTGANAGRETIVSNVLIVAGGASTLSFSALPNPVANTDTFVIETGRYFVMCAGTVAANIFKAYDVLTGTWTALANAGLPGSWGTDGKLVATPSNDIFASGTATSATATTLSNTSKNWSVNQWTNYQIRITSGTGIGQIRTITSNTATAITVTTAWTINPDATSNYEITGNDDFLYMMGNNAVTMYRYSISNNTWSTLAPIVARSGNPVAGMSANWAGKTSDVNWGIENAIIDGRYIYSFRGGGSNVLDRYDIAANSWGVVSYVNMAETFASGSSYGINGRYIYIRKDATNRFFKYDIIGNYLESLSVNLYPDGGAVVGDKLWISVYQEENVTKATWLYSLRNSGNELHRILLF